MTPRQPLITPSYLGSIPSAISLRQFFTVIRAFHPCERSLLTPPSCCALKSLLIQLRFLCFLNPLAEFLPHGFYCNIPQRDERSSLPVCLPLTLTWGR